MSMSSSRNLSLLLSLSLSLSLSSSSFSSSSLSSSSSSSFVFHWSARVGLALALVIGHASSFGGGVPWRRSPLYVTHHNGESSITVPRSLALRTVSEPTTTPRLVEEDDSDSNDSDDTTIGTVVILVPSQDADTLPSGFGKRSPLSNLPSVQEAAVHLAKKIGYVTDGRVSTRVLPVSGNNHNDNEETEQRAMEDANVLVALQISSHSDLPILSKLFSKRRKANAANKCQFALGGKSYLPFVGPYDAANPSWAASFPWTVEASALRLQTKMKDLMERWTSDDFAVAVALFLHQFVALPAGTTVPWVEHSIDATWEKGPLRNLEEFVSMVNNCGDCVTACIQDDDCRACLQALDEVDTRDQVASYRTVVSYESELLRNFSFCILQKNNVFGCSATIPQRPIAQVMTTFRGQPLTTDMAKGILIGHLDDEEALEGGGGTDISWKVACGANVAYDQFPSQNQLFYSSVDGRFMWYDPVFRVETIDGRNVWAKRHYKVRYGKVPGTFFFSVLDNGVTSNEFWTLAGAADDLSWVVFHYAGAAGAVGQRYLGGLLCTSDGSLPTEDAREEIWDIFRSRCGIEPWELFVVDNDTQSKGALDAGDPPLQFYRKDVLARKAEKQQEAL